MSKDSPTNVMNKEVDRTLSLDRRNLAFVGVARRNEQGFTNKRDEQGG